MAKVLYYVDDHTDFFPSLKYIVAECGVEFAEGVSNFVGPGRPVERFMEAMKSFQYNENARFLLDIHMPILPRVQTRLRWPPGCIDEHFCGIALALWLCETKGVIQIHVALLTHLHGYREAYQAAAAQVGLNELQWCLKDEPSGIAEWLRN
jgi:hypothetical protein